MQSNESPLDLESGDGKAWLESVNKALKGRDFQSLRTETLDGIVLEPLYPCNQGAPAVSVRPAGQPWRVVYKLNSRQLQDANLEIRTAASNGCDCVEIVLPSSPSVHGPSLELSSANHASELLDGIEPGSIGIRISGGLDSAVALAAIIEHAGRNGAGPSELDVTQVFDLTLVPFGCAVKDQAGHRAECLRDQANELGTMGVDWNLAAISAIPWHDAGANNVTELALCLSQLAESLRICEEAGFQPQQYCNRLGAVISADSDQFATIAKFRAVRILLNHALQSCGFDAGHLPVHAETSWRMMTLNDPWVNLLRTTLACFSAGIGGADSIAVLPHDLASGRIDDLSMRLSRNAQTILLEESNLDKVSDPAAGSGIIEDLTDKYCDLAWKKFLEIEKAGGLIKAFEDGLVNSMISTTAESRQKLVSTGKSPITGVSAYPNMEDDIAHDKTVARESSLTGAIDQPLEILPNVAWFKTLCESVSKSGKFPYPLEKHQSEPPKHQLSFCRVSEPFEKLRKKAKMKSDSGQTPTVFLAGLGPLAGFQSAATFAKNFFEAAGIHAMVSEDGQSPADLAQSFDESGAKIACLCADKAGYAELGVQAFQEIRKAGALKLYAVGRKSDFGDELAKLEIEAEIHKGCEMLDILSGALESA